MPLRKSLLTAAALFGAALANVALADGHEEKIRAAFARVIPGLTVDGIRPSPVEGLYAVTAGHRIFYMSGDGENLISGDFYDLKTRTNLTDEHVATVRRDALKGLGDERTVAYAPEETKHTVTIFTDIDCPYCRKLHQEMDAYHAAGIKVRYLLYPRAGIGSPSYDKSVSVWCADDRNAAMDKAKRMEAIDSKRCDNPVADHLALGEVFGIRGTPAIVLENGEVIPGYVPAERLAARLNGHMATK